MNDQDIRNSIFKLEVFKAITEYQIRWLTTNYEIPDLTYQIITKRFKNMNKDVANGLLHEWIRYERDNNIAVFSKSRFNEDSNVELVMKLQTLIRSLDSQINGLWGKIADECERENNEDKSPFKVVKEEDGFTITFFNKSWFKRDNVIYLSKSDAEELKRQLQ